MNLQFLTGIDSTSSALSAERMRMEVITQNIANAHVTRGADGQPYQRQQVVFENMLQQHTAALQNGAGQLRVSRIETDQRPPRLIHNPSHPDANAQGMVAIPDINIHEEMADLIVSSRAFEANLAVIKNARHIAIQTLSIGKR